MRTDTPHVETWQPATGTDLQAAIAEYPEHSHRWRPAANQVGTLSEQLASATGQAPPEPLTEQFQETLLWTIASDEEFRSAVRNLLNMEGATA